MKEREDELFHDFLNTALIFYPAVGAERERKEREEKKVGSHIWEYLC